MKYVQITVPRTKRPVDWEYICALGGYASRKMIVSKEIAVPDRTWARLFSPKLFLNKLALNTAAQAVVGSGVPMYARKMGIIDVQGVCTEEIAHLITLCPLVKIFTKERERYDLFAEEMMDRFGAPLVFCDRLEGLGDCSLILSTEKASLTVEGRLAPPVISTGETVIQGDARVIDRWVPKVPLEIQELIPWDIDSCAFMGALWEIGGVDRLGDVYASLGYCKNREVTLQQLGVYLWEQHQRNKEM